MIRAGLDGRNRSRLLGADALRRPNANVMRDDAASKPNASPRHGRLRVRHKPGDAGASTGGSAFVATAAAGDGMLSPESRDNRREGGRDFPEGVFVFPYTGVRDCASRRPARPKSSRRRPHARFGDADDALQFRPMRPAPAPGLPDPSARKARVGQGLRNNLPRTSGEQERICKARL